MGFTKDFMGFLGRFRDVAGVSAFSINVRVVSVDFRSGISMHFRRVSGNFVGLQIVAGALQEYSKGILRCFSGFKGFSGMFQWVSRKF